MGSIVFDVWNFLVAAVVDFYSILIHGTENNSTRNEWRSKSLCKSNWKIQWIKFDCNKHRHFTLILFFFFSFNLDPQIHRFFLKQFSNFTFHLIFDSILCGLFVCFFFSLNRKENEKEKNKPRKRKLISRVFHYEV